MKRKILIIGVQGFLGSSLWEYIKTQNLAFDVYGIDSRAGAVRSPSVFVCSLHNQTKLRKILSKVKPKYIFHLAGGKSDNRGQLFDAHFLTTEDLFETVIRLKNYRPRIVIPGSAAEYGEANGGRKPIDEKRDPQPNTWYGFVKYMQTNLSLMYARRGLPVMVARMFNISGERNPSSLALGRFAKEICLMEKKRRKRGTLRTQPLDGTRDFLDIRDVCSALLTVAREGRPGSIYNVCSGTSHVMRDVLKRLVSFSQAKDLVIKEKQGQPESIHHSVGSNKKILRETTWKPTVSFEQSLKDTLEYYRKTI